MFGAIIGDLAGSIYEYEQTKKIKPIHKKKIIEDNAFYSDDTILTMAVLEAILDNNNYEYYLKKYINKYKDYKPNFEPYFKSAFSKGLIKWSQGDSTNDSIGNGAMMRISPVGYMFNSEEDILLHSRLATIPSHNSKEAITCATIVALMIYYFRKKMSKEEVYRKLNLNVNYKPFTKFNVTCSETINNCLYALYISNSFEDAISKTLEMGGDTDTNSAIVGSIAESIYGIDDNLKKEASKKLPDEFIKTLRKVYKN